MAEVAYYRFERTLEGCADPDLLRGVGAPPRGVLESTKKNKEDGSTVSLAKKVRES